MNSSQDESAINQTRPDLAKVTGAIVLAAGSGTRLGEPKQFLDLYPGQTLLDESISRLVPVANTIVVVLPPDSQWASRTIVQTCVGGTHRLSSLREGIDRLSDEVEIVLVHDAAHPLASVDLMRSLQAEISNGSPVAVPWLACADVIKRLEKGNLSLVGRDGLGSVQVPMAFSRESIDRLSDHLDSGSVEESQVASNLGMAATAVAGEAANVHVVDQSSLALVRLISIGLRASADLAAD